MMHAHNYAAFVVTFVIGIGIALILYALLRNSLRELLNNVVRIPEGTTFYLRALVLVFVFEAASKVLAQFDLKPEAHFMEYVWAAAGHLSNAFADLSIDLLIYLGLITVLVVVLKPKNGK
jgi:hypothetical protein